MPSELVRGAGGGGKEILMIEILEGNGRTTWVLAQLITLYTVLHATA